ncbi:hypothetical protein H5410_062226 [Solanum commersonii]|uniref:Uncharacterized protein n=1 Tax=Solanum commersonii TaxID=4109 RepID=A0A9J5WAZ7_SOLCO|nr:hypothetical protein H5410_062226 [Solanum commersonii]
MACGKDDDGDDLYKIYEQFKELSPNVIDNDKVMSSYKISKILKSELKSLIKLVIPRKKNI